MLYAVRFLGGLVGLSATLAKPMDFVSISYTTASTAASIPTSIPGLASERFVAERRVSAANEGRFTAPGWAFISCFTDEINARALVTQVHIKGGPENMSVSQCNYACWIQGFILSGVEFAHECWCGHALNGEHHLKVPESECNIACAGDHTEVCGGANRVAVYEYNSPPVLETGKPIFLPPTLAARSFDIMSLYHSLGCYEDSLTARMLQKQVASSGTEHGMAVEACTTTCYNLGYPYAGLEYGDECFCDTVMQTLVKASDTDCTMTCPGDSEEICGGNLRINVYSYNGPKPLNATLTTASPTTATSSTTIPSSSPITAPGTYELKGCFSDLTYNRTLGFVGSFPGSREGMTLEPCLGACKNAGYVFAGVEFGHECWCDDVMRGVGVPVADGECNMACSGNSSETCGGSNRINIYSFAPALSTSSTPTTITDYFPTSTSSSPQPSLYFESIGCYTDTRDNRTLRFVGDYPGAHGKMAIEPCQWACRNAGYMLAGVEFGDECWCDDAIRGTGIRTSDSDCNTTCHGNSLESCGGSDRINIYQSVLITTSNAPIALSTSARPAFTTTSPGSESVCIEYYTVAQGDLCYSIWTSFRISQEQFTAWNPSLIFPQCQIFVGQLVCVQYGPTGSSVLTITALLSTITPITEMPATAAFSSTVKILDESAASDPITTSLAGGPASTMVASTVSCSIFYQVAQDDYCSQIWTSFGISQVQFAIWNPSLIFPRCQISPGSFVCVQEGQSPTTTVTTLSAVILSSSTDSSFSTSTRSATITSTVTVMRSFMSSSVSLTVAPLAVNSVPTSTVTSITSDTTSSRGGHC